VDLIDSISISVTKRAHPLIPFAQQKKTRLNWPGLFLESPKNLAMVMMMTVMMPSSSVGRNHRTSQDDKRDSSKKQSTQFH
jgi:hypothetical protein